MAQPTARTRVTWPHAWLLSPHDRSCSDRDRRAARALGGDPALRGDHLDGLGRDSSRANGVAPWPSSLNQASGSRIEASRLEGSANRKETIHVSLFTDWLQADAARDQHLGDYLAARFQEPLKLANAAWVATSPPTNPQAPSSPLSCRSMCSKLVAAQAADKRTDEKVAWLNVPTAGRCPGSPPRRTELARAGGGSGGRLVRSTRSGGPPPAQHRCRRGSTR